MGAADLNSIRICDAPSQRGSPVNSGSAHVGKQARRSKPGSRGTGSSPLGDEEPSAVPMAVRVSRMASTPAMLPPSGCPKTRKPCRARGASAEGDRPVAEPLREEDSRGEAGVAKIAAMVPRPIRARSRWRSSCGDAAPHDDDEDARYEVPGRDARLLNQLRDASYSDGPSRDARGDGGPDHAVRYHLRDGAVELSGARSSLEERRVEFAVDAVDREAEFRPPALLGVGRKARRNREDALDLAGLKRLFGGRLA